MSVIRIEKNREFVVMSNKFLREKEMSLKAKGLLALCLSLPDTWNYSLNGLCAICKENLTAIRSTLKELEKFGYLKINKLKNEKGRFVYEYIIYETAQPTNDEPDIENLYMENQYVENLPIENNRQLNINKEIIKEESIKEENLYIEHEEIIHERVEDKELQQLYRDYLEMRKSINSPLSGRGLKMLITRCSNLSNDNVKVQKLMLENAVINQWRNIYRPKEEEIEARLNAEINDMRALFGLQ